MMRSDRRRSRPDGRGVISTEVALLLAVLICGAMVALQQVSGTTSSLAEQGGDCFASAMAAGSSETMAPAPEPPDDGPVRHRSARRKGSDNGRGNRNRLTKHRW